MERVAFVGEFTLSAQVVADNGTPIVPVSVLDFAGNTPGFGIAEDMDGVKRLTLEHKVPGSPYAVTVVINNVPTVIGNVEFVGGRPPVIRK